MALVTGTPVGSVTTNEEIVLEGAPNIYVQDASATPLSNPDSEGFYWGLSGTTTNPVFLLGCVTDVSLGEDVTMNQVRCDTVGDKDTVQKRNYIELTLTMSHLFPLEALATTLNLSTVTETIATHTQKVGIGKINNNKYFHVYLPKVYDESTGDYLLIHLHRAKFVDAWSIAMASGDVWKVSGIKLRAFIDESKPAGQEFGTIVRSDFSAIS